MTVVSLALVMPVIGGLGCKKKPAEKKGDQGSMAAMGQVAEAMDGMGLKGPMGGPGPAERRVAPRATTDTAPVDKNATAEAVLSEVSGTVEIRRSGAEEFSAAAKDTKVYAKDAVRVGKDGEAVLALWDNSTVELTPESAVSVNSSEAIKNPSPSVTVLAGAVRFDINQREEGQGPFGVYTPSSVVNVQGTVLAVGVGLSGASRVAVEEGKVELVPVAKVDAKPVVVAKGKVVVVPYNKVPTAPAAYNPDSWDTWLESEDNKAAKNADTTAKLYADEVNSLADDAQKLDEASDQTGAASEKLVTEANQAATKKDVKLYKSVQPRLENDVETYAALHDQRRFVNSRLAAHAYLLALMRARAHAGVYKLRPKQLAMLDKYEERAIKRADQRRRYRLKHRQVRRRRVRALRRAYLLHDANGRALAPKLKVKVPEFYRKVKLRRRLRRRAVRVKGYRRPLYRRPRYRGKYRKAHAKRMAMVRRQKNWYRNKAYRQERKKHLAKRAVYRKRWRQTVLKRRRARWAKRPQVRVRRNWRRNRPGMGPAGMRFGMGPAGMHFGMRDDMGPRGMRFGMRDDMGPHRGRFRTMRPDMRFGMGPAGMGPHRGRFRSMRPGMKTPAEIRRDRMKRRKMRRDMRHPMGM